ncbi:MAG: SDR family NAD(P)-dependent oxidoreductase [Acidimicrobiia bacterium]
MSAELAGEVAIVTGGASGLGEAIARRFAEEGSKVILADLDEVGARRVADAIVDEGGAAEVVSVDVTHEADVAAMIHDTVARHRRLDVLVCSAAVETRASVVECTDDDWKRVLDVNLKGPFLCMKHAIPAMVASGGGSIILMSSVLGSIGSPGYAAYCASKGGLQNLAKQAAIEHAADGVRVNVIAPTACEAGLFLKVIQQAPDPEGIKAFVAARTPMGRLGSIDDVTDAAMFLATDASAYVSGAVIPLDGGLAARRV